MIREIVADLRGLLPTSCRVVERNGWVVITTPTTIARLRPERAEMLIARLPVEPSQRSIAVVDALTRRPYQHPKRRIILALAKLRRRVPCLALDLE